MSGFEYELKSKWVQIQKNENIFWPQKKKKSNKETITRIQ